MSSEFYMGIEIHNDFYANKRLHQFIRGEHKVRSVNLFVKAKKKRSLGYYGKIPTESLFSPYKIKMKKYR